MLCRDCRRLVPRDAPACPVCGRAAAERDLALITGDGRRVRLDRPLVVGRAAEADVRIEDASVSRRHAAISVGPVRVVDSGSRHGTWVDGALADEPVALTDGSALRVGDAELRVERERAEHEPLPTVVFADGQSAPARPRLRAGVAVKRLDASEAPRRWVVRSPSGDRVVRIGDAEGSLLELLDGRHGLSELVGQAERLHGDAGAALLAQTLAALAGEGLLQDSAAPPPATPSRSGERSWVGAGAAVERLYRSGGWLLFTRPGLAALAALALAGPVALGVLLARDLAKPLVVGGSFLAGVGVFAAARLAGVALHELAHALTLCAMGRRAGRAGVRLSVPAAFVDTGERSLEPRRRRLAVVAAGPAADAVLGGAAALAACAVSAGALREVLLCVALSGFAGLLANLRPGRAADARELFGGRRLYGPWLAVTAVLAAAVAVRAADGVDVAAVLALLAALTFVSLVREEEVVGRRLRRLRLRGGRW